MAVAGEAVAVASAAQLADLLRVALSGYDPAPDGFEWRDMLTEVDNEASHGYTSDVRRMLHSIPGAAARLSWRRKIGSPAA